MHNLPSLKLSLFCICWNNGSPAASCRREYYIRRPGRRHFLPASGIGGAAAVASVRRSPGAGGENAGEPSSPTSTTPSTSSSSSSSTSSRQAVARGGEKREEKKHNNQRRFRSPHVTSSLGRNKNLQRVCRGTGLVC